METISITIQVPYDIPRGSIGKAITNEFSNLFENVMERKCNFEKIIVFTQVLLQRENNVTVSKDIKKRLKLRLDCWQSGKFKMLVETTEQALKARQTTARGSTTPAQRAKTGNLRSALRYISDTECGGLLYPDDIDEKSNKSVGEVLQDKHPQSRDPGPAAMKHYEELSDFIDLDITSEHVENVAKKMSGAAGLSGFDSSARKFLLLSHGQASNCLRSVIAKFSQWLSNDTPPFAAFRAALANRLIVRPIGIGDVWRRLIAKCVLSVAGHSATTACGSDQLCAGLRAGTDGAIHGVSTLWNELEESDSDSGFLLIDANNAFNEINRINMLWTIRHEWPAGARFAFNCYSHHSLLIVRNAGGTALFIFSKEGVTQGDPIAMFCYGIIGILPMIRDLKQRHSELKQPWYADDAGALGSFDAIARMFTDLMKIGPDFGYYPNPSKSILITPTNKLANAEQHFDQSLWSWFPCMFRSPVSGRIHW
jgi:hypothetical protein